MGLNPAESNFGVCSPLSRINKKQNATMPSRHIRVFFQQAVTFNFYVESDAISDTKEFYCVWCVYKIIY